MRKVAVMCLTLTFAFTVASCSSPKTAIDVSGKDSEYVFEPIFSVDLEIEREQVYVKGVIIKTISLVNTGGLSTYNIKIPYIDNYSDELIRSINRLIYEAIPVDIFDYRDYRNELKIDYVVTHADDRLLSILFTGYGSGMSYADYKKAVTIDLERGEVLTLGAFFSLPELRSVISENIESENCSVSYISDFNTDFIYDEHFNTAEAKRDIEIHSLARFNETETFLRTDNYFIMESKICLIGENLPSLREYAVVEFNIGETPRVKHG